MYVYAALLFTTAWIFAPSAMSAEPAERPALEKAEALTGSNYAVIAPAYDAVGSTNSFIRLFNGGPTQTTFNIAIVNAATGVQVATAAVPVLSLAAPEYQLSTIFSTYANYHPAAGGTYALYITAQELLAGYQHIIFADGAGLFENASVCKTYLQDVMSPMTNSIVVTGLNTSSPYVAAYPSQLQIHNFAASTKNFNATVLDANYGLAQGNKVPITIGPNTSVILPFISKLQQVAGWTPSSIDVFANVIITDNNADVPQALVGSIIDTSAKAGGGANSNMSTICAVNAPLLPPTITGSVTSSSTLEGEVTSDNGVNGTIALSIVNSTVSGMLYYVGQKIPLTGAYTNATQTISVTGSGYTFSAPVVYGSYAGTYTGPNNTSGMFSATNVAIGIYERPYELFVTTIPLISGKSGSVTSSPAGINCTTCDSVINGATDEKYYTSAIFGQGTVVTLTVTPAGTAIASISASTGVPVSASDCNKRGAPGATVSCKLTMATPRQHIVVTYQ